MPAVPACPEVVQYQRLASGQMLAPEKEALLEHLEHCEACAARMEQLAGNDTLVEMIRQARTSGIVPGSDTIAYLVERLGVLRPELCALLAPPQAPDELGRLGPYRVLRVLGVGGMGVVFQAEDPSLQRLIALKAMLPGLAASASAKLRFLREARAAAKIKHDHVVIIHQVGEERGVPFLAMEFLEGESLDDRLKREGKLPLADVFRIGREIAAGLGAAHDRGLVHRDIKPANVWLEASPGRKSGEYRVKILDFGLARASADEAHLTQSGAIVGTPAYMAPEQSRGGIVDGRCDLFSLGCILYRMATGEAPFKGADAISTLFTVAAEDPALPASLNSELPTELSDFIMQLLAKSPAERPASAQTVADTLERMGRDRGADIPVCHGRQESLPQANGMPASRGARRNRRLTVAALALAALVPLSFWLSGISVRVDSKDATRTPKVIPKETARKVQSPVVAFAPVDGKTRYKNALGMEFALISKGKAWLGGSAGKPGDHEVEFKDDFYMGVYPVTQEQWDRLIVVQTGNPSWFSRSGPGKEAMSDIRDASLKRFPVENITWYQCRQFIANLNIEAKEIGWIYLLPTEAEWEYACRGGPMADKRESAFDFCFDKPANQLLPGQANFGTGDKGRTCEVGLYAANRLGLHDMHGNVQVWCDDDVPNPINPGAGALAVIRGGSYLSPAEYCRAGARFVHPHSYCHPSCGLRVVRIPVDIKPGTVWKGNRAYQKGAYAPANVSYELHVRERDGTKFKGHVFDNGPGRNHAEVAGEIQGNAIHWRERPGHMPEAELTMHGTLQGDTIRFKFKGDYGKGRLSNEGDGQLKMSSRVQK